MKHSTVDMLASYVDALHPIIYINHFDSRVIDEAICGTSGCGHWCRF